MQTIFITSFHGLVSRILEGGIVEMLVKNGIRVVLLVPDFKKGYFERVFSGMNNVIVEGIDAACLPRRAHYFHALSFMLLDTGTMRLIRKTYRGYQHEPVKRFFVQALSETIGRHRVGRAFFRWLNYRFSGRSIFTHYFEKYRPGLIFSTDSKHMLDTAIIIEAKKRDVPTAAMVRSWDYLTAKGTVRVLPDTLIVHNAIIKDEAVALADMPVHAIHVVGMPHFDPYTNTKRSSRSRFFARIGAHPKKRLILLAPVGEKFGDTDAELFELLDEAIHSGALPGDLQILVRVPPGDDVPIARVPCRLHILLDYPGTTFDERNRKANEMSYADVLHLADSIHHSEMLLSSPSTMVIDAAAFDKPIILFSFEGKQEKDYLDSFVHAYDYGHMVEVRKTGGTLMVRTPDDLFKAIRYYLDHPDTDQRERARIVYEQCGALNGRAGERTADILLSKILAL